MSLRRFAIKEVNDWTLEMANNYTIAFFFDSKWPTIQGLEMYGVYYFEIQSKSLLRSKQKCNLWLGICPFGINIYEDEDQLMPIRRFLWKELENIKFKKRQFIIILDNKNKKKKEKFTVSKTRINKIILDLCIGYHQIFAQRPKTSSLLN